jgi:hypothetical protein
MLDSLLPPTCQDANILRFGTCGSEVHCSKTLSDVEWIKYAVFGKPACFCWIAPQRDFHDIEP